MSIFTRARATADPPPARPPGPTHSPDMSACPDCLDLVRVDGLDLRRLVSVTHYGSYSTLRLLPLAEGGLDAPRWRAVRIHPEPDRLLEAVRRSAVPA